MSRCSPELLACSGSCGVAGWFLMKPARFMLLFCGLLVFSIGVRSALAQSPERSQRTGQEPDRVYKDRITPHWFQNNTRFWYRNDLRGGARELIVVDAERATRGRAFDHETVAKKIGEGVEPTRLPINELRFSDDGQKVTLIGPDKSWELNEVTGELREAPAEKPAAAGLPAET